MTADDSRAILGISADYHDAAAALLVEGSLVAAAEEERFTRHKHDPSLPENAIAWCLEEAGLGPGDLDGIAFYAKPLTIYERLLRTHARVGPAGLGALSRSMRVWAGSKLWVPHRIDRALRRLGHPPAPIVYLEHHQSHAASAFYPSPFEHAAVITCDGVGEWATSTIGHGTGHRLRLLREQLFPDSLGLFYSTMTAHCGFEVNDGEYKLMGLAPYGDPTYVDVLRDRVIRIHEDGSVTLDQRYFRYRAGRRMGAPALDRLLGGPPRRPDQPLSQREADIAHATQRIIEEAVLAAARHAFDLTQEPVACLAGGVALNCVANERLLDEGPFRDIWVQPAAGDSGGALGAAWWTWHELWDRPRDSPPSPDGMAGSAIGPSFTTDDIAAYLRARGVRHRTFEDRSDLHQHVAARLAEGKVIGLLRGAMEFGPRALGHRSILADPRAASMVGHINRSVKQREGFRPFAPAVLAEAASTWFDLQGEAPYMIRTARVKGFVPELGEPLASESFAERLGRVRSPLPACTAVDGSARVQTVDEGRAPDLHALIRTFGDLTGCPVLLNTSFNGRGEPIVCTPADALATFGATGLDVLVLEDCVIEASDLAPEPR